MAIGWRACQPRAMRSPAPAVLAVLLLAGCASFTVRTRQDPGEDFSALRTFGWLPVSEAAPADQRTQDRAIDRRLRAAVDRELTAKGYAPAADERSADLLVNWRITSTPTSAAQGDPLYAWGTGWRTGWDGGAALYGENYDSGTLFIAALDPRSKQIVWLGAAEARLLPHVSLDRRLERVDAAVRATLKDFPAR
jgi:hypothetical protein